MDRNPLELDLTGRTSRLDEEGDTVAMMDVLVRPPSESCRILVSFDSLWRKRTSLIESYIISELRRDSTQQETCCKDLKRQKWK